MPIPGGGESGGKEGWARGCRGWQGTVRAGRETAELMFTVTHECGLIR